MENNTVPASLLARLRTRRLGGFTLLELIVVLIVLAILALIAVPSYQAVKDRATDRVQEITLDGLLRDAAALAALDGRDTISDADMTTAASEMYNPSGTATGLFAAGGASFSITKVSRAGDGSASAASGSVEPDVNNPYDVVYGFDPTDSIAASVASATYSRTGHCTHGVADGISSITTWTDTEDCTIEGTIAFYPGTASTTTTTTVATTTTTTTTAPLVALDLTSSEVTDNMDDVLLTGQPVSDYVTSDPANMEFCATQDPIQTDITAGFAISYTSYPLPGGTTIEGLTAFTINGSQVNQYQWTNCREGSTSKVGWVKTATINTPTWCSGTWDPTAIAVGGASLFVADGAGCGISKFALSGLSGSQLTTSTASSGSLEYYNGGLWTTSGDGYLPGRVLRYDSSTGDRTMTAGQSVRNYTDVVPMAGGVWVINDLGQAGFVSDANLDMTPGGTGTDPTISWTVGGIGKNTNPVLYGDRIYYRAPVGGTYMGYFNAADGTGQTGFDPSGMSYLPDDLVVATGVSGASRVFYSSNLLGSTHEVKALALAATSRPAAVALDATAGSSSASATEISSIPYTSPTVDTTYLVADPGDPTPSCASSSSPSQWFRYTAASDGTLVADTYASDFDTILVVYQADTVTEVGCNDDGSGAPQYQSKVTFAVTAGSTYYLRAAGYGSNIGNLVLSLSAAPPPAGADSAADATVISALDYTSPAIDLSTMSQSEATDPVPSCGQLYYTTWFKYTSDGSDFTVTKDYQPSGNDEGIAVFTGSPGSLTEVACDATDASPWNWPATVSVTSPTAGTDYYFMVGDRYASDDASGDTIVYVTSP